MRDTYSRLAAKLQPHMRRGALPSVIYHSGDGGSGGGAYLPLDGTGVMIGNIDLGGNDIVNVNLINGYDLSAIVSAGHARLHNILSTSDHTVTGAQYQVVGLTATNALGLLDSTTDGATNHNTLLRSPADGAVLTLPSVKSTLGIIAKQFRPLDTNGFAFYNDAGTQVMRLTDAGTLIKGTGLSSLVDGVDITGNVLIVGDLEVTGAFDVGTVTGDFVYTGDGSFRTPSLSFQDDDDLGIFRFDENVMGFTAAGELIALFGPTEALLFEAAVAGDLDANTIHVSGDLTFDGLFNQIIFQNGATLSGLASEPVTFVGADVKISGGNLAMGSTTIANSAGKIFGTGTLASSLA
ncbi:MAG: hypothetical protein KDE53_00975, partial [Caldilineaceae bacterium]|nr:hypothetical protein [Caldilineaceae bacterium]